MVMGIKVEVERSEELERVVEDEEEVVELVKECEVVEEGNKEEEEGEEEEGLLNRTRTNDVASTQKNASKFFLRINLL